MLVYEINTRCWLRELSLQQRAPVTLANVPESQFQQWRKLGFTHLWLMGVWTSGTRSRAVALAVEDLQKVYGSPAHQVQPADIAGSPYAISGYNVPAALGGIDGLRSFRNRLNNHGIKLLLDFVPNHVGLDHPWLTENPDRFVNSSVRAAGFFEQTTRQGRRWIAHGKDPYFPPWTDTAQLDYRNPDTRAAMQRQLLEIAALCDGVRCDMAMLILNEVFQSNWSKFPVADGKASAPEVEFWPNAIATVRQCFPHFTFVAEVYWGLERRLQEMGFDFTYNKELYDDLMRRDFDALGQRLAQSAPAFLSRSVHFLENHDEPRAASLLNFQEHRLALLLLLSLPGMRLLHEGQLTGAKFRIPVQVGRRCAEPTDDAIAGMYEQLLHAALTAQLGIGTFSVLQTPQVFALQWRRSATDISVSVLNFSDRAQAFSLPLAGGNWKVEPMFPAAGAETVNSDFHAQVRAKSGILLRVTAA